MNMNDGNGGIVVAIERTVAQNLSPTFLQFLLRNELRYWNDAIYYIFRKENEILGYTEIRYWNSVLLEKPITYFINPLFQDLGIEKQMLSFVLGDNTYTSLSMSVENFEIEKIKIIESFSFKLKNTSKIYNLHTNKFVCSGEKLPASQMNKLSKELKKQFEQSLMEKVKNVSSILADEAMVGKENEFFQKFVKDISMQNSYLYVSEGEIKGWILLKKDGDKKLTLIDASRSCSEEEFSKFLRGVFGELSQKDFVVKMEMIDDDAMAKLIVNLFAVKPDKVFYNYVRRAGRVQE